MDSNLQNLELPIRTAIEAAIATGDSEAVLSLFEQQRRQFREELERVARERWEEHSAELRRCEAEYRTLTENSPDGIIRLDRDFRIIQANSAAAGIMRTAPADLPGKSPIEFPMPLHLASMWHSGIKRVIANGRKETFEYEFDDLRTVHYLRITMIPEFDPEGRVESVLAITRDISEQKKVVVALRESEERFRIALATSPMIVYSQDGDFRYTWVYSSNPKLPADTFLGRTDHDLYPADEAEQRVALKRRVLQTGTPFRGEHEATTAVGKVWLDVTVAPLRNNEGQIVGITGVALDITERKRVEETLRESEARYRALVTASSDVLYRMSPDWSEMCQLNSPSFLANTERPNPDWLQEYIPPDDQLRVTAAINEAVRTRSVFELEHRVRRASGDVGWTFSRAIPILNENGEIIEWFGSASDITQRKRAEEALRESESKLRAIFSAMQDVILVLDSEGRYIEIDPARPDLLYQSAAELLGKTLAEVFPAEQAEFFLHHIRKTLDTQQPVTMEYRLRIGDADHWFSAMFSPLSEKSVLVVARDITGRIRAEEALRESRDQLQAIIDNTPAAIYVKDTAGKIIVANQALADILGHRKEDVLGKTSYDFYPGKIAEEHITNDREIMERGEPVSFEEIVPENGSVRTFLSVKFPLKDDTGKVYAVGGVSSEITERKRTEEKIARLRREREALMRHEVKNLFAPVQLFTETLLADKENLTGEQIHSLTRIAESVELIAGFIDTMKRTHDLETGVYRLKRATYPLDGVIRQVIRNLEPIMEQNGVTVRFQTAERDATVPIDRQLMPGVFTNLILNAIEHVAGLKNPAEKIVLVDLVRESGHLIVRINNKGTPIPPERVATFFDRFNTGPEKKTGTGLGTTYALLVTRAHGGDIRVTSNEEEGTTVTVALPG